jgi:hypothetical protein
MASSFFIISIWLNTLFRRLTDFGGADDSAIPLYKTGLKTRFIRINGLVSFITKADILDNSFILFFVDNYY